MSNKRSPVTTHILDTAKGKPAVGVAVILEQESKGQWQKLGQGQSDNDGRVGNLLNPEHKLQNGRYRLHFATGAYLGGKTFFPAVQIEFEVKDGNEHHHVPLLLSPFGYSTYRGS